jgi:hypothetical protein
MQRLQILDEAADLNDKFPSETLRQELLANAMPWLSNKEAPSVFIYLILGK